MYTHTYIYIYIYVYMYMYMYICMPGELAPAAAGAASGDSLTYEVMNFLILF